MNQPPTWYEYRFGPPGLSIDFRFRIYAYYPQLISYASSFGPLFVIPPSSESMKHFYWSPHPYKVRRWLWSPWFCSQFFQVCYWRQIGWIYSLQQFLSCWGILTQTLIVVRSGQSIPNWVRIDFFVPQTSWTARSSGHQLASFLGLGREARFHQD